jgi:DNA end-binding protein Ku
LLNIPVQLYSGARSMDLHFRLLDARDRAPIRYERINSESGEEVAWKDIVKAYEYEKGNYVVVPEEEIRAAAPEATETVEVEAFVEREVISPVYFEKPYYLVPRKQAEKGYVLLRETMKRTGRVGIGKVVIRTRQYLAALIAEGDALLLNLMRFPQELVEADEFELPARDLSAYHVADRELQMAAMLVDSMTTKWNPQDYHDDFRDQLHGFIQRRIAAESGKHVPEPEAPPAPRASTNVVDFMALLRQSLESKGRSPRAARGAATKAAAGKARPARASSAKAHARASTHARSPARAGRGGTRRHAS